MLDIILFCGQTSQSPNSGVCKDEYSETWQVYILCILVKQM